MVRTYIKAGIMVYKILEIALGNHQGAQQVYFPRGGQVLNITGTIDGSLLMSVLARDDPRFDQNLGAFVVYNNSAFELPRYHKWVGCVRTSRGLAHVFLEQEVAVLEQHPLPPTV